MTAPDQVVRLLSERLMKHGDLPTADELIDDGFVDHSNLLSGGAGKHELSGLVLTARRDDPTLTSSVVASRSGGDLAMVPVVSTIAGRGWREFHVFRVADARILERWGLRTRADAGSGLNPGGCSSPCPHCPAAAVERHLVRSPQTPTPGRPPTPRTAPAGAQRRRSTRLQPTPRSRRCW